MTFEYMVEKTFALPSAFGVFVVTLLKMLTKTRKRVMRSAIRPGITSGGTTKLIQETTTNKPESLEHISYLHMSSLAL